MKLNKKALRLKLLSLKEENPILAWEPKAISDNLLKNYFFSKDKVIAGYWPMRNEADPRYLIAKLFKFGCMICLPEVTSYSKILNFRKWRPFDPLRPGKFGTSQPWGDQPLLVPDVILTPLVGFDKKGSRLGYGAGYYDTTITNLKKNKDQTIVVIGVGREIQRVNFVPISEHDERLDIVVTEENFERLD